MKIKNVLLMCWIFIGACSNPIVDTNEVYIKKSFNIIPDKLSTITKSNDSVYILQIDTTQWQTFIKLQANTDEKIVTRIKWNAFCRKTVIYYHSGLPFEAPLINQYSYTDGDGVAYTMFSAYKELMTDTILVTGGYNDHGKYTYFDYFYFIVKYKTNF